MGACFCQVVNNERFAVKLKFVLALFGQQRVLVGAGLRPFFLQHAGK